MHVLPLRNGLTDELVYAWCMCLLKGMPESGLWTQQKSSLGGTSPPVRSSQTTSPTLPEAKKELFLLVIK